MKKWTSLSLVDEESRWRMLSEKIQAAGCPNEFTPWTGPVDETLTLSMLDEFDHVRISNRIAPRLVKQLKAQSTWTTLLGVVDGMNKTPHGWWPLCALYESFGQLLIHMGQDLDVRGSVFIAGAGGAARIAIAAFFRAGFRDYIITNFDEKEAALMIKDINSRFFGLNMKWVPREKIVLLPGECSILVNCTPIVADNALLMELSYLNFLKRPGILFDTNRSTKDSILVHEAEDVGMRVINGMGLAARTDILWAKWGFQVELDVKTYEPALNAALGFE